MHDCPPGAPRVKIGGRRGCRPRFLGEIFFGHEILFYKRAGQGGTKAEAATANAGLHRPWERNEGGPGHSKVPLGVRHFFARRHAPVALEAFWPLLGKGGRPRPVVIQISSPNPGFWG